MNFEDHPDDDPLSELLAAPRLSSSPDPVRAVVLTQAAGVLRRRRWLPLGTYAVSLAICYFAGLATMAYVRHDDRPLVATTSEQHAPVSSQGPSVATAPDSHTAEDSEAFADQVTPTHASFGFYRAAGDYQLLRLGDLQAAVRLYSQALDLASPADLAISAGSDSWLLMSLKQSRIQDARDVHEEG